MARTIVITSGKGGVGKSNVGVNIAVELARQQYRTCLFDADLGLANVNLLFGLQPECTVDDLLADDVPLETILVKTELGVDVLPGSSGVELMANLDQEQLASLLTRFKALDGYDYLLIDTASGISRGVISFCLAAEETILVLTGEATSLADAYALLKVLSLNGYRGRVRILVNKCTSIPQAKKVYRHFQKVVDKHLKVNVCPGGAVLHDPLVTKAVSLQYPAVALYPESLYAQCIRALVANMLRIRDEEQVTPQQYGNFWSRYADFVASGLVLPDGSSTGTSVEDVEYKENSTAAPPKGSGRATAVGVDGTAGQVAGLWGQWSLPGPWPLYDYILQEEGLGRLRGEQLRQLVAHDPVLLGRLLEATALRCTPLSGGTLSLTGIIEELGEETVHRFMVTSATHSLLEAESIEEFQAVNEIWLHSCRCALTAEALAGLVGYPLPEEAYIAGLLHDIGRLAFLVRFPELSTTGAVHDHSEEHLQNEVDAAGRNHAELGAEILNSWGASRYVVDAARYHCESSERIATALDLTRLVCLAHNLSCPVESQVISAVEQTEQLLGLTSAQVFIVMQSVSEEIAGLASFYGVGVSRNQQLQGAEERLRQYRRRAVTMTTLQSTLPLASHVGTVEEEVRTICEGLYLLFGLGRAICLLPDHQCGHLRAVGCQGGYGHNFVENVVFQLASSTSRIVDAYRVKGVTCISGDELETMADRQLLRLMRAEGFLCLPLKTAATCVGLIICGVRSDELSELRSCREKLELFAARAAVGLHYGCDRTGDA